MLSSIGRAAIRRGGVGARFASTNRALQSIWCLQRVNVSRGANEPNTKFQLAILFPRSYATATKTVTKSGPKAKAKTIKAAKAKPKTKVKKPVKKPVKKKVVKPKAKKPKKPAKKVRTDDQKKRAQIKKLKERALSPPPKKADDPWKLFLQQELAQRRGSGEPVSNVSKNAGAKYRALSPQEREVSKPLKRPRRC